MAHPRVQQLRFARSEWVRGLRGLSEADAQHRLLPMNSISWMVGHLAWHERRISIERGQGLRVEPMLDAVASGQPASTPELAAMWAAWRRMTAQADAFLDTLTTADLLRPLPHDDRTDPPSAGSQLQRITYHYWAHIGEASAVRQMLGHRRLAQFVGSIEQLAPYRPEGD
jgi:hypothetical protein